MARASKGYSASEIEQAVVVGRCRPCQQAILDESYLLTAIGQTRPLSVLMAEKFDGLRNWDSDRTIPVH